MTRDLGRDLTETLEQASRSAPTTIETPAPRHVSHRRWLVPLVAAAAVAGIAASITVLLSFRADESSSKDASATKDSAAPCTPVDQSLPASKNPDHELAGERLASRLNHFAHAFHGTVILIYVPSEGSWLVVDRGREDLLPQWRRGIENLKAPEPIMVRQSCVTHQQLNNLQSEIMTRFRGKGMGQVSSGQNLLTGQVEVFVSSPQTGKEISRQYGDLVHVEQGVVCSDVRGQSCGGSDPPTAD
jgi:hypothetical protein